TPTPGLEINFTGDVESLNENTATIGGFAVTFDANTDFENFGGQPLAVGQNVEVHGWLLTDGSVLATKIDLKSSPPPTPPPNVEIEFTGFVEALNADTATIDGFTVRFDGNTNFENFNGQPLAIGQHVAVHGWLLTDGSVLATKIDLKG
ncbi:MAG: DUF5666 domain-containing protein, partial [Dehalococcoidia bacterium]